MCINIILRCVERGIKEVLFLFLGGDVKMHCNPSQIWVFIIIIILGSSRCKQPAACPLPHPHLQWPGQCSPPPPPAGCRAGSWVPHTRFHLFPPPPQPVDMAYINTKTGTRLVLRPPVAPLRAAAGSPAEVWGVPPATHCHGMTGGHHCSFSAKLTALFWVPDLS